MEDRLLALKKTKNVNTAAPEMVEEYTEEQIKDIHEKYSRIIKTMQNCLMMHFSLLWRNIKGL